MYSLSAPGSTEHLFLVPAVPFVILGVLTLVLRWAYSDRRLPTDQGRVGDQGLLVPVVTARNADEGERMIARLAEAGIRAARSGSTTTPLILVWPHQARAAREALTHDD